MAEGFDFVLVAMARFTSQPAIIDLASGRTISFTELEWLTRDRAHGLLARGFGVCAIQAAPSVEYVLWLIAAFRAGVVVFPISPRWPKARARELAQLAGATELIDCPQPITGAIRPFQNRLDAPATILATSGSSGEPKRVVHALAGHLTNARGSASKLPLRPGCGWLLNLPIYHVSGLSVLFRCLNEGAAILLPAPNAVEATWRDPRVTHASVVSTQLRRLLDQGIDLKPLRAVLAGGGSFAPELVNRAIAAGYPIHLTYGMTEAGSQITTTARLTEPADDFSAGTPNREMEVRLAETGEVQIRSQALCLGYQEENGVIRSARAPDGWFQTRDAGHRDRSGQLWITGRLDRLFISGGENIHPEAIERELEACPEVARAVVLPLNDETFGHRPVAFVQWKQSAAEPAVREILAKRLPKFMQPTCFLEWPREVDSQGAKLPLEPFRERVWQIAAENRGGPAG